MTRLVIIALVVIASPLAFANKHAGATPTNCSHANVYGGDDNTRDSVPNNDVKRVKLSLNGKARLTPDLRTPAEQQTQHTR
jgi:hypothetical protein